MRIFEPKPGVKTVSATMRDELVRLKSNKGPADRLLSEELPVHDFEFHSTAEEEEIRVWSGRISAWHQEQHKWHVRLAAHALRKQYAINAIVLNSVRALFSSLHVFSGKLTGFYRDFRTLVSHVTVLAGRMDRMQTRLSQLDRNLEAGLENTGRSLALLNQETKETRVAVERSAARAAENLPGELIDKNDLDAFYLAFENLFRGSREDIKKRVEFYLPIIRKAVAAVPGSRVLDVGCGRGEWLELLKENDLPARGIDLNRSMIGLCARLSLDVVEADVTQYLRSVPDSSLCAVTGFHIIEHLPFETLMNLMRETLRVLAPGGVAIFETPNPANLLVSSHSFHLDPTHKNPLPHLLMRFVAEYTGFRDVNIAELHPPESQLTVRPDDSPAAKQFAASVNGPMDYAVIGWKPSL